MEEHENTLVRSENKAKPTREKIITGFGSEAKNDGVGLSVFPTFAVNNTSSMLLLHWIRIYGYDNIGFASSQSLLRNII